MWCLTVLIVASINENVCSTCDNGVTKSWSLDGILERYCPLWNTEYSQHAVHCSQKLYSKSFCSLGFAGQRRNIVRLLRTNLRSTCFVLHSSKFTLKTDLVAGLRFSFWLWHVVSLCVVVCCSSALCTHACVLTVDFMSISFPTLFFLLCFYGIPCIGADPVCSDSLVWLHFSCSSPARECAHFAHGLGIPFQFSSGLSLFFWLLSVVKLSLSYCLSNLLCLDSV